MAKLNDCDGLVHDVEKEFLWLSIKTDSIAVTVLLPNLNHRGKAKKKRKKNSPCLPYQSSYSSLNAANVPYQNALA
jgi:hypothetical protein